MNETHESSATVLEILLGSVPAEKHGVILKAWHEHVAADPESIAAQWALVHFSLVAGMRENTTRVSMLRSAFLEARDQLEKRGGEMTTEFRVEDSRTAAKMADYLKVIEEGNGAYRTRIEELDRATQTVKEVGSDTKERIREMEKAVRGYFGTVAIAVLILTFLCGAVAGAWLVTR